MSINSDNLEQSQNTAIFPDGVPLRSADMLPSFS